MSKKIIIIGPAYPLRGGLATFDEELAQNLQNDGHTVELWSYKLQYPSFLFPGKTQYSESEAPENLTIRTEINSINPFNWVTVGRKLKQANADIVFVRYWMSFFGPSLGTILRFIDKRKTEVITLVDNIIPHEKRFFDKPFNSYFLKANSRFVCMSQEVSDDLRQFTDKPITVTLHPLYLSFGQPQEKNSSCKKLDFPNDEKKNLLFFGFIRRYKGLDILLEALSLVIPTHNYFRLIVAGEFYEDDKFYLDLIQKYDLEKYLIWKTDYIPNEQVADYFGASDLVVLPYRNATQSGITQVAIQCEKPILATRVGGLPEFVIDEKTGWLCEPDAESLAEKIIHYLNEPKDFKNEIKAFKQKFSWQEFINNVNFAQSKMK